MTDNDETPQTTTVTLDALDLLLMDGGPYCLIRARADEDGELVLNVRSGGGAEEEPAYLPLMMVMAQPVDKNPLAQALITIRAELNEELGDDTIDGAMIALNRIARELQIDVEELS